MKSAICKGDSGCKAQNSRRRWRRRRVSARGQRRHLGKPERPRDAGTPAAHRASPDPGCGALHLDAGLLVSSCQCVRVTGSQLELQAAELVLHLDYVIDHISCPCKLRGTGETCTLNVSITASEERGGQSQGRGSRPVLRHGTQVGELYKRTEPASLPTRWLLPPTLCSHLQSGDSSGPFTRPWGKTSITVP